MSEFMGLIQGSYDGKQGGFAPGGILSNHAFLTAYALYVAKSHGGTLRIRSSPTH